MAGFVGDSNQWTGKVIEKSNKHVTIACDAGFNAIGQLSSEQSISVGDQATAFVRPEHIHVNTNFDNSASIATSDNTLTGHIDSLLFNGANSRVLVRDQAGELIEADVTLTGASEDPKPGDAVRLSWEPARSLCF